ncbi:MAG: hypothetical protein K2X29_09445 [Candidatus Obscuribacterales bacterium]|nr:hypothetical protein [Candidatus Obscuribacterales bacterium]
MSRFMPLVLTAILVIAPSTFWQSDKAVLFQASGAHAASQRDIVDFNTNSLKYHDPNCIWAKRCTVNCIKISRGEAKRRGGIPCKVCGGGE